MNKSILSAFVLLAAVGCTGGSSAGGPLWLAAGEPNLQGEPYYEYRILNHWDNLDDTVERGYAGHSIWEWTSDEIPSDRIHEYGRLNESIGINGSVLNNVNASPAILDRAHLDRVRKIADILREYGIKVYLSVNFSSPLALGELDTADPLDPDVIDWWNRKADEIYGIIQIKNGPIDFQPREPVSPLFFNMHSTQMMPELQITQEYMGQGEQMCYLGTMWKEALDTLDSNGAPRMNAIAGVANIGQDANWCGRMAPP